MHSLSWFLALKAGILNITGNKEYPNGYIIDIEKLIKVFFNNINWVFEYTAQNVEIKYQKITLIKILK